jgi:hypothetical protein
MAQICEVWVGIRRGGEKTLAAAATPLNQKRDEVAGSGGPGRPYASASAAPPAPALHVYVPRPRPGRCTTAHRGPPGHAGTPAAPGRRAWHRRLQRRACRRGTRGLFLRNTFADGAFLTFLSSMGYFCRICPFDPAASSHFRVFLLVSHRPGLNTDVTGVKIYSSKTGA